MHYPEHRIAQWGHYGPKWDEFIQNYLLDIINKYSQYEEYSYPRETLNSSFSMQTNIGKLLKNGKLSTDDLTKVINTPSEGAPLNIADQLMRLARIFSYPPIVNLIDQNIIEAGAILQMASTSDPIEVAFITYCFSHQIMLDVLNRNAIPQEELIKRVQSVIQEMRIRNEEEHFIVFYWLCQSHPTLDEQWNAYDASLSDNPESIRP